MLCDICKVNEATISYTEIMNGVTKEKHICFACAAKFAGLDSQHFSMQGGGFLTNLLAGLLMNYEGQISEGDMKKSNFVCPSCGTTYNEFVKYGKVGCHDCYRMFSFVMDDFLKDHHGSAQHTGMAPKYQDLFVDIPELKILKDEPIELMPKLQPEADAEVCSDDQPDALSSIKLLELRLKEALEAEEYETAAHIRDMIKEKKALIKAVDHE